MAGGVNLLPTKEQKQVVSEKIDGIVRMVTTGVLVSYIVVLAGVAGWWLFLASREKAVSTEMAGLELDVKKLADVEAVLRQEENRAKLITGVLGSRIETATVAGKLASVPGNLAVEAWSWQVGAGQTVGVVASSAGEIEQYAEGLKTVFPAVEIAVMRKINQVWEGTIDAK